MLAGLSSGIRLARIIGQVPLPLYCQIQSPADTTPQLHKNTHTVLGTVVVAALLLQPFFGYIHHRRYIRTQKRSPWIALHVWYCRILILLGIMNGGLGLQLASGSPTYSRAGMIVYSVLATLSGFPLVVIVVASFFLAERGSERC